MEGRDGKKNETKKEEAFISEQARRQRRDRHQDAHTNASPCGRLEVRRCVCVCEGGSIRRHLLSLTRHPSLPSFFVKCTPSLSVPSSDLSLCSKADRDEEPTCRAPRLRAHLMLVRDGLLAVVGVVLELRALGADVGATKEAKVVRRCPSVRTKHRLIILGSAVAGAGLGWLIRPPHLLPRLIQRLHKHPLGGREHLVHLVLRHVDLVAHRELRVEVCRCDNEAKVADVLLWLVCSLSGILHEGLRQLIAFLRQRDIPITAVEVQAVGGQLKPKLINLALRTRVSESVDDAITAIVVAVPGSLPAGLAVVAVHRRGHGSHRRGETVAILLGLGKRMEMLVILIMRVDTLLRMQVV